MTARESRLSWGHLNINVRDLERSIEFYEQLGFSVFMSSIPYLGLTTETAPSLIPEPAASALGFEGPIGGRACIMQLGAGFPKLDLTELDGVNPQAPPSNADLGCVRFCLASQDLAADYERLSQSGVEFVSAPAPGRDGMADIALCKDPDGTLIELIQIHLDKWRAEPANE
jgi:predicted enzyme related to lactoylglutathione lyase